jgi:hypothetical protein
MKLYGMADAFREQIQTADSSQLSFEERFGLLVDRQWSWKEGRALTRRLQLAKFKERGVVRLTEPEHFSRELCHQGRYSPNSNRPRRSH